MDATKILAIKDNYLGGLGGSVFALPKAQTETPSDYVRRIIAEKGLSHVKVAQRAKALGGELSPGYVNSIIQGHVKSPSVDMVYNLSLGLGEPVEDLLAIYLGQILPEDSMFKRSAFVTLYNECEHLSDSDKRDVRVLLDALKRDIQRRTLKS
jgi:transcriptional regulator with XRE-family HTH domain